jgi:hypothetical protein
VWWSTFSGFWMKPKWEFRARCASLAS